MLPLQQQQQNVFLLSVLYWVQHSVLGTQGQPDWKSSNISIFYPQFRAKTGLSWSFRVMLWIWNCADLLETQRVTGWFWIWINQTVETGNDPSKNKPFLFGWVKNNNKKQGASVWVWMNESSIFSLDVMTKWWTFFLGQSSVGHRRGTR